MQPDMNIFREMKAGPVSELTEICGISSAQMRMWRTQGDLKFGRPSDRERGHPSYALEDAAIAVLAAELRRRGVETDKVPPICNEVRPYLVLLAEMLLLKNSGIEPGGEAVPRIIEVNRNGLLTGPFHRDGPEFSDLMSCGAFTSVLFFDLGAIVTTAFHYLAGMFNVSSAQLSHPNFLIDVAQDG